MRCGTREVESERLGRVKVQSDAIHQVGRD